MKVREIIKLIEEDGWFLIATKGSHRQYKHLSKLGRVTIAGHPSDERGSWNVEQYLEAVAAEDRERVIRCIDSL